MLLNEYLDFFQLALVPSLKPRRVMEDELWVAFKGKWPIDIMDAMLISGKIKYAGLVSESK
jgi:hypothetical protein